MNADQRRALLPLIAINAVIVGVFVTLGIVLGFPFWMVIAFVVIETVLSLVEGLRLLK